ncbi:hypothetical protein PIB30_014102 [Stylosanthes scabra]|uniref:Uncharacterized protein n=1 Tax=Stylosanthes scabra TaxID=79078 RepID=A0ABU6S795_9FABA|nr:hypothetical protein [Stylosanthes scabra]
MEKDLHQDHLIPNPPSLLHLPNPLRNLRRPLQENHEQLPRNERHATRHTSIQQALRHGFFGMGNVLPLQDHILHFPSHLLPPLHLRRRLHRRLHLHFKRSHLQENHERRSKGLEEAHGHFPLRLRRLLPLQLRHRHGHLPSLANNRPRQRRGRRNFHPRSLDIFRWIYLSHGDLATSQRCFGVGGIIRIPSDEEEQGFDQGEDVGVGDHILEA